MSIFDTIGDALKTVAPWIASALPGPLGGLAKSAVAAALGSKDTSDDSIQMALSNATPDQLIALKKAELDFQSKMQALGFQQTSDLEKIAADDRANARQREEVVKDNTPKILAYGITVGFFGVLAWIQFGSPTVAAHDALMIMLGALTTAWISVVTYYYGSSTGSKDKDATISKLSSTP
jgi:hypothetical protein